MSTSTSTAHAATPLSDQEVRAEVDGIRLWYHTLELRPGITTPGWFDLRRLVQELPWPDVSGKRCLDVGCYDGALAFELERRGAAEVVAVDISDHTQWDFPPRSRASGPTGLGHVAGDKHAGFMVARRALGSAVDHRQVSAYDLSPETVGEFDVVVCGNLLLHLRDPFRALEAIRGVCTGSFLSLEPVSLGQTALNPTLPAFAFVGDESLTQWFVPNRRAHTTMLDRAGFDVGDVRFPLVQRYGVSHPSPTTTLITRTQSLYKRTRLGADGVACQAVATRVAVID